MSDKDVGLADDVATDTLLLQASQQYEASLNSDENVGMASMEDVGMANEDMVSDTLLLQASQQYEASLRSDQNVGVGSMEDVGVANEDVAMDTILLQASQQYEASVMCDEVADCTSGRFGKPITDKELNVVKELGVPKKTKQSTAGLLMYGRSGQ